MKVSRFIYQLALAAQFKQQESSADNTAENAAFSLAPAEALSAQEGLFYIEIAVLNP